MKELDHPNIVKLHEVYENKDWIFFVQELCDGNELFYYITQKKFLTENEAA
jgi:serine/threonine protein kinase